MILKEETVKQIDKGIKEACVSEVEAAFARLLAILYKKGMVDGEEFAWIRRDGEINGGDNAK